MDNIIKEAEERLYQPNIKYYEGMTDTSSWFELFHVVPIISKLYNVDILSYDNFDNNNSLNKKTHLFFLKFN